MIYYYYYIISDQIKLLSLYCCRNRSPFDTITIDHIKWLPQYCFVEKGVHLITIANIISDHIKQLPLSFFL
jgi:hypothetical protein